MNTKKMNKGAMKQIRTRHDMTKHNKMKILKIRQNKARAR